MPNYRELDQERFSQILPIVWEQKPYWGFMGLYFGFPPCCINEFCSLHWSERNFSETHPSFGTGYVPCFHCRDKITTVNDHHQFVQDNIEPYRFIKDSFPIDDIEHPLDFLELLTQLKPLISETHFSEIIKTIKRCF